MRRSALLCIRNNDTTGIQRTDIMNDELETFYYINE
jgi:hypothetical protein